MMFWVSLACIAVHFSRESNRVGWLLLGWTAAGFAVLTKGPVGLVVPLLIGIAEALARQEQIRRLFHPLGIAAFVLIVGPWFLAVTQSHPEFLHYAFVRETFERVATDKMNRTGPIYYVAAFLIVGALPWISLLFLGGRHLIGFWRQRLDTARTEVFQLLWILMPLLFFTLSQSKRPGYILPVLPAVALLCARLLQVAPHLLRYAAWTAAGIGFMLGSILLFGSDALAPHIYVSRIAQVLDAQGPVLGIALIAAAGMALLGAVSPNRAIAGLIMIPVALLLGIQGVLAELGEYRSARALARVIEISAPEAIQVIGVEAYSPSLAYYLEMPILLATGNQVRQIRSNYIQEYGEALRKLPDSTLRSEHWWQQALAQCTVPAVFLVKAEALDKCASLAAALPLILEGPNHAAYSPCKQVAH